MCRAKAESGGRRCYFHQYGRSIQSLRNTIALKEQDLARVQSIKMKTAAVNRQLRDLEASLKKKTAYLERKEAELETVTRIIVEPETSPLIKAAQEIVAVAQADVDAVEAELAELRSQPQKKTAALNQREKALVELLERKREALRVVEEEAKASKEAAAGEAAAKEAAKPIRIRPLFTTEEDGSGLKVPLTETEKKELVKRLGENEDLTSYVLRASIDNQPTFSGTHAAGYGERRKTEHQNGMKAGRIPGVDRNVRNKTIGIREEVANRAVLTHINNSMAWAYELETGDYLRRRLFNTDLYGSEPQVGVKRQKARLEALTRREAEKGITAETSQEEIVAVREAEFRENFNQAVADATQRFGEYEVAAALHLNHIERRAA